MANPKIRDTPEIKPILPDPVDSAKAAGLRYVTDERPGITRKRRGKGFEYLGPDGKRVDDDEEALRINSLAIPPAWTEVWICPDPLGHLQATGRDARGRKQHRYHPRWREVRDETKYEKMIDFAKALPLIRRTARRHLKLSGLSREKVLAAVVTLLEKTLIRVGNDEYARSNQSYGLTTLRDKHADIRGATVSFEFRGKSGVEHTVDIEDPHLAKIIRNCQDLPGYELFQYVDDDGAVVDVGSQDVNDYLREITGKDFTAKDFRTWAGTVLAAMALREVGAAFTSQTQAKKNIVQAVETVSRRLGNTKAVCRKCYIHPAILDSYMDGTTIETLRERAGRQLRESIGRLRPEEAAVLALLQRRLTKAARSRSGPGSGNSSRKVLHHGSSTRRRKVA